MPENDVTDFYNAMADDYHLIFADWVASVKRHGTIIDRLIRDNLPEYNVPVHVLDCACGIGTQSLGLAQHGYRVHATDISPEAITRARNEAQSMKLQLTFGVADMRELSRHIHMQYDAVIAFDNAIPHLLTDEELSQAARELFAATRSNGIFMASIRDYDALLGERPRFHSERVFDSPDGRRVTFQVWEWEGDVYEITQFIMRRTDDDWQMRHYTTRYRALRRETVTAALRSAGFTDITWQMPETGGFYQPVVIASKTT